MERTSKSAQSDVAGRFSLGVEVVIAVPPIRVWKALIEPEDMRNWFCEFADVDTKPSGHYTFGGRYSYRLDGLESAGQALLGYETGRNVRFAWDVDGQPSVVRYALSDERGDCRLRVVHELTGRPHEDARGESADHYPWENYLLNLKMYLERGNPGIRVDYENVPGGRQVITGEVRCASERIWRVLTDPSECSRRAAQRVDFDPSADEGWTEPFGIVRIVDSAPGKMLHQRWEARSGGSVDVRWALVSKGVSSRVELASWGEGALESWHTGRDGLWTYLSWCRIFNTLKFYSETGSLTGLRRVTGEL